MTTELQRARWFNRLLSSTLQEAPDVSSAVAAAELAYSCQPDPPAMLSVDVPECPGCPVPVPDVVQSKADSCQEAALASVCKLFGKGPQTEAAAIKALDWTAKTAIAPAKVKQCLLESGLTVDAKEQMTVEDLTRATTAGWPVIAFIQDYGKTNVPGAEWTGHVVVVKKVIPSRILVQDPSEDNVTRGAGTIGAPGEVSITEERFLKAWHVKDEGGREWDRFGIVVSDGEAALSIRLSHDIFDEQAQEILDKAVKAGKKLSAAARKELAEALRTADSLPEMGRRLVDFLRKYRQQLTELLGATQLTAILQGAREVAERIPALPPGGLGVPPPPTLAPDEAIVLLDRLRLMPADARVQAIYELPAAEQEFANQTFFLEGIAPPPPFVPEAPPEGSPEEIYWPIIDGAVEHLREKNVIDRAGFDRLDAAARQKAFTITGVDSTATLEKVRDALANVTEEGVDLEAFRQKILESVDEGTFLSDAHMEVVFRTNIQAAFSDGQMDLLRQPFIRGGFPYAAYDAIHDDRVRHNHLALEKYGIQGMNIYRVDDPVFETFRPPWDYSDRCSWTPLTVRMAADLGIQEAIQWLATGVEPRPPAFVKPPPFLPPPGFRRSLSARPLAAQLSLEPLASFGAMLGMVGDEWHGPTAPGPGWVMVRQGQRGGKVWKQQGGQQSKQEGQADPSQHVEVVREALNKMAAETGLTREQILAAVGQLQKEPPKGEGTPPGGTPGGTPAPAPAPERSSASADLEKQHADLTQRTTGLSNAGIAAIAQEMGVPVRGAREQMIQTLHQFLDRMAVSAQQEDIIKPRIPQQPSPAGQQAIAAVQGYLSGINSGKVGTALIDKALEPLASLSVEELPAVLQALKIAQKPRSRKEAVELVRQQLANQSQMFVKSHAGQPQQPIQTVDLAAVYNNAKGLTDEQQAQAFAYSDMASKEELQAILKEMGFITKPADSRVSLATQYKQYVSNRRGATQRARLLDRQETGLSLDHPRFEPVPGTSEWRLVEE